MPKPISYFAKNGFTILEVLIAVVMIGIVSVAIMTIMSNASKQQKAIQSKDALRELTGEIRNVLSEQAACKKTFFNRSISPTTSFTVTDILDGSGAIKYHVGTSYMGNLIELSKLGMAELIMDTPFTGKAKLAIQILKSGLSDSNRTISQQVISIKVKLSGGAISDCVAIGSQSDSLWSLATNGSDIFFPGGLVGIGPLDPKVKLDVDGEIKVGNTGAPCGASNEGAIRYNGINKIMEYCNGTQWSPMGSGGALIANAVGLGGSVSVAANTCKKAVKVEMSMSAFRNDTPTSPYLGRQFLVYINGGTDPQLTLEFGSVKGGSSGHGWNYKANGLSKVFYTTNVSMNNDFMSALVGNPIITITDAVFTVSCLD